MEGLSKCIYALGCLILPVLKGMGVEIIPLYQSQAEGISFPFIFTNKIQIFKKAY